MKMVADGGVRGLVAPFPGGAPRPEVEQVKTSNLYWFENVAQLRDSSLHFESGDMVKRYTTFNCKQEVNSTKQEMDAQFFSPTFGGITNTPSSVGSSQLYSGWSTCGDDASAVAALQDYTKIRAQVNLSYSGNSPDMFGLVANILEDTEKQETATDWNSLSRLFPPLWSPDFENSSGFSDLFPGMVLGKDDLTSLVDVHKSYGENWQEASSVELSKSELSDLHDVGSWASSRSVGIQSPAGILKKADTDGKAPKSIEPNQSLFVHGQDYEESSHGGVPSPRSKRKDSTNGEGPKSDRGRGMAVTRRGTEGSCDGFIQLPHSAGGMWDPVIQENNVRSERYSGFAETRPYLSYPSEHFPNPAFNKENSFPEGIGSEFQDSYPQNSRSGGTSVSSPFHKGEPKVPLQPLKAPCSQLSLKPSAQNVTPSCSGRAWLETKRPNPGAYGKQKEMASGRPSGPSTKRPAGQLSYPQKPPALSLRNGGQQPLFNNIPSLSGFSNSTENQKQQRKPLGYPQHRSSAATEGCYDKALVNVAHSCVSQQRSLNEVAKHRGFANQPNRHNTDERTGQNERRPRHTSIPCMGYKGPLDQPQLDIWGRKPEPKGVALTDFINPSFLPLFPLVSGYKAVPNFSALNPHPFSSPANVAFPLSPFLWPELAELLPYDDLPHFSPFLHDLFCGEAAPPHGAFPPPPGHCRPPRSRSGPASELHFHLEECYEQWRALERERKKTEADLARCFPGKHVSVSSNAPFSRLPAKPSRVDRLIVDQFREQARVHSLVGKMERLCGIPVHRNIPAALGRHMEAICATQAKRKEEIVNAVNPQRPGTPRYNNEKDVLALAAAIKDLAFFTRKTRTALWCAFQTTVPKASAGALVKKEDVERALEELCPVACSLPAKSLAEQEDKENKKKNPNEHQPAVQ